MTGGLPIGATWTELRHDEPHSWETMRRKIGEHRGGPRVRVTLLRHGESAANASSKISGQSETRLTDDGAEEVQCVARALRDDGIAFDATFSPELPRSKQTVELLALGDVPLGFRGTDRRLSERNLGTLEREQWIYVPAYAQGNMLWAPRGGETYQALTRRCLSFLVDLQQLAANVGQELDVLVCTSRGPLRVLTGLLTGAHDSRDVLNQEFDHAARNQYAFTSITFPRFAQL